MRATLTISCFLIVGTLTELHCETLLASDLAPTTSGFITIVAAYQMDDEIWISADVEWPVSGGQAVTYPMDSAEVSLPSIVAKYVGNLQYVFSDRCLYFHRQQVANYDFEAGDGWVETEVAGWLYIREYPWVLHPNLGWLWSIEGEITADRYPEDVFAGGNWPKKLTFYFFSERFGWMWKSPYTERYYVFDNARFMSLAEINAG